MILLLDTSKAISELYPAFQHLLCNLCTCREGAHLKPGLKGKGKKIRNITVTTRVPYKYKEQDLALTKIPGTDYFGLSNGAITQFRNLHVSKRKFIMHSKQVLNVVALFFRIACRGYFVTV